MCYASRSFVREVETELYAEKMLEAHDVSYLSSKNEQWREQCSQVLKHLSIKSNPPRDGLI